MSVSDEVAHVPLDDVEAAVAFYRKRQAEGGISEDDMQVLLMAQSDPGLLIARLAQIRRETGRRPHR